MGEESGGAEDDAQPAGGDGELHGAVARGEVVLAGGGMLLTASRSRRRAW